MTLSIHETTVTYPEPAPRYIIEENTPCGWRILAITESEKEATELYDRLNNQEAEYV